MKDYQALERRYRELSGRLGLPAEVLMLQSRSAFLEQWWHDLGEGRGERKRLVLGDRYAWLWRYHVVDPEEGGLPAEGLVAAILDSKLRPGREPSRRVADRDKEAAKPADPCAECRPDDDIRREMCA